MKVTCWEEVPLETKTPLTVRVVPVANVRFTPALSWRITPDPTVELLLIVWLPADTMTVCPLTAAERAEAIVG